MNTRRLVATALMLFAGAEALTAQDSARRTGPVKGSVLDGVTVRTFLLKYMDPNDAAKLVTPYVDYTPAGGVYSAGSVRGITVRGNAAVLLRVDSLLKANDKPPAIVRLTYKVIAAVDSAVHDPAIASLEPSLRSILRFTGYRLISQGASSATEAEPSEISMNAGNGTYLNASTRITHVDVAGNGGSVSMYVTLRGGYSPGGSGQAGIILATGVSAPLGEPIVVGTGAPMRAPPRPGVAVESSDYSAIILVVRAEVVSRP